jgi:hypothetical protein
LQIPELDTPTVDDHREPASLEQSPKAKLVDDAERSRVRRKDGKLAERDLPGMSAGHAEADWADVQDGGFDDRQTWSAPPDVVDADDRESGPATERVNNHLHASRSSQQLSEIH